MYVSRIPLATHYSRFPSKTLLFLDIKTKRPKTWDALPDLEAPISENYVGFLCILIQFWSAVQCGYQSAARAVFWNGEHK